MELKRERSLDSLKGRGAHHPQRRRRRLNVDSDAFEGLFTIMRRSSLASSSAKSSSSSFKNFSEKEAKSRSCGGTVRGSAGGSGRRTVVGLELVGLVCEAEAWASPLAERVGAWRVHCRLEAGERRARSARASPSISLAIRRAALARRPRQTWSCRKGFVCAGVDPNAWRTSSAPYPTP